MQPTATAQSTRSEVTLLYMLPRIPLRLNTTTNQPRGVRKMKPRIKGRQNKRRSTDWTKVESMTTTTRRQLLSSISNNRKLFLTKKRLHRKMRPPEIQRSQKTPSRWKLSSAQ